MESGDGLLALPPSSGLLMPVVEWRPAAASDLWGADASDDLYTAHACPEPRSADVPLAFSRQPSLDHVAGSELDADGGDSRSLVSPRLRALALAKGRAAVESLWGGDDSGHTAGPSGAHGEQEGGDNGEDVGDGSLSPSDDDEEEDAKMERLRAFTAAEMRKQSDQRADATVLQNHLIAELGHTDPWLNVHST